MWVRLSRCFASLLFASSSPFVRFYSLVGRFFVVVTPSYISVRLCVCLRVLLLGFLTRSDLRFPFSTGRLVRRVSCAFVSPSSSPPGFHQAFVGCCLVSLLVSVSSVFSSGHFLSFFVRVWPSGSLFSFVFLRGLVLLSVGECL